MLNFHFVPLIWASIHLLSLLISSNGFPANNCLSYRCVCYWGSMTFRKQTNLDDLIKKKQQPWNPTAVWHLFIQALCMCKRAKWMVLVNQPCQIMCFQIQASLISKSDRIWPLAHMLDSCSKKIIGLMANSSCLYQSSFSTDTTLSHCALATDLFKLQLFDFTSSYWCEFPLSCIFVCFSSAFSLLPSPTILSLYRTHVQALCFSGIKLFCEIICQTFTSICSSVQEASLTAILFSPLASLFFCLVLGSMSCYRLPSCSRLVLP